MTSARQIRVNRANARASTGPRSAKGKARASQNARRHGLSLSIYLQPTLSAEAENLAREIAGERVAAAEIFECSRRIAEAQIELNRVRQARLDLLARDLSTEKYLRTSGKLLKLVVTYARRYGPTTPLPPEVVRLIRPEGAEKFAYILRDLTKQLAALDRYERRALSRRKFAIRELDALRQLPTL
jgi:hypothetical protein